MRNNIYLTFSTSVVLSASLLVSGVTPGWSEDLHQVDVDGCTYNLSLGKQPINDWIDAYGGEDGLSKWPYWGNQPLASAIALNEGVPYKEGVSTFLPWNDSYISGGKTYTPSYHVPEGKEAKVQHSKTQRWLVAFDSQSCDSGPVNIEKTHSLSSVPEKTAPVFDGGTLEVDKVGETKQDFHVNNLEGNTIDSKGNYVRFAGEFDGQGGLTFEGSPGETQEGNSPEIQLSGNVGYTGKTVVATSGGVALAIQDKRATPKGDVIIQNGGILRLRGDGIELNGDVVLEKAGQIGISGKGVRIKGDIRLDEEKGQSIIWVDEKLPRGEQYTDANGQKVWTRPEINGVISGKGGLTKQGEGFLVLTEKNTYTGPTRIQRGVLYLHSDASLSPETTVEIIDGARFTLNNQSQQIAELTGKGEVKFDRVGATLTVGTNNKGFEFAGVILGEGSLEKIGSNVFTLSGKNTYKGRTTVQNGTLQIANVNGLGSADSGTRVEDDATLRISVSGQKSDPGTNSQNDARIAENITLAGGELDLDGNYIDLRGGIVLEGDVNSTIRVKDGSTEVFARSGEVIGEGGLIKKGKGYLRLATPLKYEGETIIEDGELRIAAVTTLPQSTAVSVNQGGTLRLMGKGNEIQSLSGDGAVILQEDISTLVSGLSGNDDEFSGVLSGKGGFEKVGEGTTTFSGKNTYLGRTTVKAGTLQASGANAFSRSSEHVVEGGTLNLNNKEQTIDTVLVEVGGQVKNGTLINQTLTNAGDIDLTGISQSNGSITNSGTITLGSGSLTATRVVNSGNLTAAGTAKVENLVNSGNATFENFEGVSSSGYSIESSARITASGDLTSVGSVYLKGNASGTIQGNVDVDRLYVGGLPNEDSAVIPSGTTTFDVTNDLRATNLVVGSAKAPHSSTVSVLRGDLYSESITVRPQGTIAARDSTIHLTNENDAEGSIEIYGDVTASSIKGSSTKDALTARAGSQLTLNGALATSLGECADGCDAAINLGAGNDLLTTEGGSISIPSGSVIDGGDIGSVVDGKWEGEINVYRNYSPEQSPGFERDQLKNFALVNYDGNWESAVDQGNCKFDQDGNLAINADTTCLLLSGEPAVQNELKITDGATLRNGVVTLDGKTLDDLASSSGLAFNSIQIEKGTLSSVLVEGNGGSNSIELGYLSPLSSQRGELGESIARGKLEIQRLRGYPTIDQLGGVWNYAGDMGDSDLKAQGLVRIADGDQAVLNKITAREREVPVDSPRDIQGRAIVGITDGAELTVNAGIHEEGKARASVLVVGQSGEGVRSELQLLNSDEELGSTYTGPTIVARGARLTAASGALSPVSKTLVGQDGSLIDIAGDQQVNRLLVRAGGAFSGGEGSSLTTQSIVNRGDINLGSLHIEDGMVRFIDRYIELKARQGGVVADDALIRKIKAQGSLKNLGGSIDLSGDLVFSSTGDGGHALLNLSTLKLDGSEARIAANSIQFSEKNDVLINSGNMTIKGVTAADGDRAIDFGAGNDLVLSKGEIAISEGTMIDGGEPLDTSQWQPGNRAISGMNIFKAYSYPGVNSGDLRNWAAIKLADELDWEFPQGGECVVTGEGKTFSADKLCIGLVGERRNQGININKGATLDAGVITLGRASRNEIHVENGNLHAILIEGNPGEEGEDDSIVLGDNDGGSGELIVGAVTGIDSIEQRGGTWSFGVKGVEDLRTRERLIKTGRRTSEELDDMGQFPALSGYGTVEVASVEVSGRDGSTQELQRAAFTSLTGDNDENVLAINNDGAELDVSQGIHGNASLQTSGQTLLKGESTYKGETLISSGGELKAGNHGAFSPVSDVTIEAGGVLDLDGYLNRIKSLNATPTRGVPATVRLGVCAGGELCTDKGGILQVRRGAYAGLIEDVDGAPGAFVKTGSFDDELILSGLNQYQSPTFVSGGVLKAGADFALSPNSTHRVIGGELDLRGFQQVLSRLDVAGGIVRVESDNPLNVAGDINFDDGRIVAYLDNGTKEDGANAPINTSTFKYQPAATLRDASHGIYAVVNPDGRTDEDDLNGTWRIIEGDVPNSAELAKKTHLIFPIQPGQDADLDADELINVGGQLYYVARFDGLDSPLDAAALKDIVLEEGSLNIVVSDKSSDEIIDDSKLPVDELDGCDLTEQLCESLDDDQTQDILDGIIGDDDQEGLEDELPVLHWGQLATLLGSGLAPRNVDAAGRGVALHNNLLVDAVFDRQPLRQFEALLANGDAEAADAGDLSYVDLQDDELDLAKRDGVSAWVKGFGGNSRADDSSVLYNDYSLSAYGTSFGVDVALSETFQIGAYGNYGDLNVNQRSGETGGGSWNPEGWGGGLTAQYSTRNFYLQSLLGASEFSGEQSRNILDVADGLGGNTAKGDKTVTSYLAALRVGAPFKSGGVLLEPQGQVVWSQNDEHGFSENHGTEKNLRLKHKNRTTNFVETQLGLKLSVPIRTGDRSLLVPSLRAAWVADWDMGNEAQEIGYKFTKKTVDFDSDLESQNGALIEAGLDYTIQNHNSTAWKIYGRGGVELWDSDRCATWRASGGVTFQF